MIYFKIPGEEQLMPFGVGNAGFRPMVGEIVHLKSKKDEGYIPYDVIAVRFSYEMINGNYLFRGIIAELSSIL